MDGHRKATQAIPGLVGGTGPSITFIQDASSLAFPVPIKFPALEEVQNRSTPYPEIPVAVIQDIAVNQCGVPPEKVQAKTLLSSISPIQEEGPSDTPAGGESNANDD
jgi:hypothetical protein